MKPMHAVLSFLLLLSAPLHAQDVVCADPSPSVTVVDTGSIATYWPQQRFGAAPEVIHAFQIDVPADFAKRSSVVTTKTAEAGFSKLLVISECPGSAEPVGDQAACVAFSYESTRVRLSANPSDSKYYCKLEPGKSYYANAISRTRLDGGLSCTDAVNCSFYVSRSAAW